MQDSRAHSFSARSLILALELVIWPISHLFSWSACFPLVVFGSYCLKDFHFFTCCRCAARGHFSDLLFVSFSGSALGFQPPDRRRQELTTPRLLLDY
jgi:hypothetical protein